MILQFFSQHWKTILLILAILFVLLDVLVMYACVVVGALGAADGRRLGALLPGAFRNSGKGGLTYERPGDSGRA